MENKKRKNSEIENEFDEEKYFKQFFLREEKINYIDDGTTFVYFSQSESEHDENHQIAPLFINSFKKFKENKIMNYEFEFELIEKNDESDTFFCKRNINVIEEIINYLNFYELIIIQLTNKIIYELCKKNIKILVEKAKKHDEMSVFKLFYNIPSNAFSLPDLCSSWKKLQLEFYAIEKKSIYLVIFLRDNFCCFNESFQMQSHLAIEKDFEELLEYNLHKQDYDKKEIISLKRDCIINGSIRCLNLLEKWGIHVNYLDKFLICVQMDDVKYFKNIMKILSQSIHISLRNSNLPIFYIIRKKALKIQKYLLDNHIKEKDYFYFSKFCIANDIFESFQLSIQKAFQLYRNKKKKKILLKNSINGIVTSIIFNKRMNFFEFIVKNLNWRDDILMNNFQEADEYIKFYKNIYPNFEKNKLYFDCDEN